MTPTPTESTPPAKTRRKKHLLANAALLLMTMLFSLAVLEIGARLLLPEDVVRNPLLEPNAEYLYRLKPGAHSVRADQAGADRPRIVYDISSQGLRDREYGPKQSGEYRIAMLGDSFTFGWSAAQQHTLSVLLEEKFHQHGRNNITVINLGTGGTGPWQQRGILRDRGFALQPDLVLHQLFLGNDLADTLGELGRSTKAYLPVWDARVRQFRRMKYPQFRADRWLELHSRAYCGMREIIGLPTYGYWLDRLPFFPHPDEPNAGPSAPRRAYLEQDLTVWYDDLNLAMDRMMATLHEIAGDCASHNSGYVLYSMPTHAEVSPKVWEMEMGRVGDGSAYTPGRGTELLYARFAQENLPAFSIAEPLRAAPDPDALYIPGDGHLTPEGAEFVAERIYEFLTKEYFLTHPDPRTAAAL